MHGFETKLESMSPNFQVTRMVKFMVRKLPLNIQVNPRELHGGVIAISWLSRLFNRPGVAGAVLLTPL